MQSETRRASGRKGQQETDTHTHTQKKERETQARPRAETADAHKQTKSRQGPHAPQCFPPRCQRKSRRKNADRKTHTLIHNGVGWWGGGGGGAEGRTHKAEGRETKRQRDRETERQREKERGKQPRRQKFVRGPRLRPPVYYTGGRKMESKGEQTAETQDELQWIVAQRLLSTLTIPGFD